MLVYLSLMTVSVIPAIRNGALVRAERRRQGLSMRELAHFVGVAHATIQRVENGTLDVAPATKARIARALRVPVSELWPRGENER
jgi:transcriptional regulator with XRE-family HTH domain